MGYAEADEGLPGISICPRCGARLVTRNLWHSCGTFTLEGLFPRSESAVLELARSYVAMLYTLGDVQVIPQKTRLTCVARVRFAGLQPHKDGLLASFALHRWVASPRIVKTVDYGPRLARSFSSWFGPKPTWTMNSRAWLQESHDIVGMQSDLRRLAIALADQPRPPFTGTATFNSASRPWTPRHLQLRHSPRE